MFYYSFKPSEQDSSVQAIIALRTSSAFQRWGLTAIVAYRFRFTSCTRIRLPCSGYYCFEPCISLSAGPSARPLPLLHPKTCMRSRISPFTDEESFSLQTDSASPPALELDFPLQAIVALSLHQPLSAGEERWFRVTRIFIRFHPLSSPFIKFVHPRSSSFIRVHNVREISSLHQIFLWQVQKVCLDLQCQMARWRAV